MFSNLRLLVVTSVILAGLIVASDWRFGDVAPIGQVYAPMSAGEAEEIKGGLQCYSTYAVSCMIYSNSECNDQACIEAGDGYTCDNSSMQVRNFDFINTYVNVGVGGVDNYVAPPANAHCYINQPCAQGVGNCVLKNGNYVCNGEAPITQGGEVFQTGYAQGSTCQSVASLTPAKHTIIATGIDPFK